MFNKLFILLIMIMRFSMGQKIVCNNRTLRTMDSNVAKIMTIGNSGRTFPENQQQVKFFCDDSYRMILKIEDYKNKCMKNLPKSVSSVILYTVKSLFNNLCKKQSKRLEKLLVAAQCGNKGSNEFHKCHMGYIDKLLGIQNAEEKMRIPHVCCEYYKLYNCITDKGSNYRECDGKDIMETIHDFIHQIFQGSVDLICSDWTEGSDKCDRLPSPPLKRKSQKRSKSFLIPLIEVLDSFPEY